MPTEELLAHEFPTPPFLIEPFIPQGGIVLTYGKTQVGKTQLALTISAALNAGLPLFDRFPVRQGPAVLFQADMTGNMQKARVLSATAHADLSSTHWVVEPDGSVPSMNIQSIPLDKDLIDRITDIDPVAVWWDTLRRVHRLPENESKSAVLVYESARRVCPLATHFFNHHPRKDSRDPDAISHPKEAFTGTSQWVDSADTSMQLVEVPGPKSPKRVALYIHKSRDAPEFLKSKPIPLEIDPDSVLLTPLT